MSRKFILYIVFLNCLAISGQAQGTKNIDSLLVGKWRLTNHNYSINNGKKIIVPTDSVTMEYVFYSNHTYSLYTVDGRFMNTNLESGKWIVMNKELKFFDRKFISTAVPELEANPEEIRLQIKNISSANFQLRTFYMAEYLGVSTYTKVK